MSFNFLKNDVIKFKMTDNGLSTIGIVYADSIGSRLNFMCNGGEDASKYGQVTSYNDIEYYRISVAKIVEPKKITIYDTSGFTPRSGAYWRGNMSFWEYKDNKMNRPSISFDASKIENLPEYICSLWEAGWFIQIDGSSPFKDIAKQIYQPPAPNRE